MCPTSRASPSRVQGCAGPSWSSASARPTIGSRSPASHPAPPRQRRQMAPHHLDEHQLAEAQADAVTAGPGLARFRHRELDQLAERIVGGPEAPAQWSEGREGGQQRIEGAHVASQEPAHEMQPLRRPRRPRGRRTAAVPPPSPRMKTQDLLEAGPPARVRRGRHGVRVAVREHEDVPGLEPARRGRTLTRSPQPSLHARRGTR